jgi:hypothetical protein
MEGSCEPFLHVVYNMHTTGEGYQLATAFQELFLSTELLALKMLPVSREIALNRSR